MPSALVETRAAPPPPAPSSKVSVPAGEGERHGAGDVPGAGAQQHLDTGRRLVRNTFARGTGQLFTWAATAVVTVLMPRYLGDDNLGRLAAATSLTFICGGLATLGINSYLTREVARGGAQRGLVLNALALRLPLALLAGAVAAVVAALLNYDPGVRQLVYLLCLNVALVAIAGVLNGTLEGLQSMRLVAAADVISKGVLVVAVALFLSQGLGLHGMAHAWNLSALAMIAVAGYAAWRAGALRGGLDVRLWRPLLAGSLPFFAWQAALTIYGHVDVLLVSLLTSPAVTGWYAAAYRIVGVASFAPVIVAGVVFPALSASASRRPHEFRAIAHRSLQAVLLLTVPIAFGSIVLAGPLIDFLGYPEPFRNSVPLIMILALHIPIVGVDMIVGSALNALDQQRRWALTGMAAAVLNPGVNLLLIPFFERSTGNGALGAAITTVLTEVFMMAVGLFLLRGRVFERRSLGVTLRCLGAGLIMAGAVWLLRDRFLPVTVLAGAAVYFLASLVLGTVSLRDVMRLRVYASSRPSAPAAAPAGGA
jgi:O-antigen/teichoic acid export membrane protein